MPRSQREPVCKYQLNLLQINMHIRVQGSAKSMQILLSNSQAGPGRTVKQEHEEISRNHVQTFSGGSVLALEDG